MTDWITEISLDLEIVKDLDPFENLIWAGIQSVITKEEIREAIDNNRLLDLPYGKYCNKEWNRLDHIERIAYLVVNRKNDPIDIDVGIPGMCEVAYIIQDGYHRLAAAYYCGDKKILASINGHIDYAKQILEIE
jgi:hypothetical protein